MSRYISPPGPRGREREFTMGSYVPSRQTEEIAQEKRQLWSVQGYGVDNGTAVGIWDMSKEPLIRAAFMGMTSWGLARLVKAQPKVAKRIGIVTGGLELVVSLGSNWLKQELKKAQ